MITVCVRQRGGSDERRARHPATLPAKRFTTPQGRAFDFVLGASGHARELRVHARRRLGAHEADRRGRALAGVLDARHGQWPRPARSTSWSTSASLTGPAWRSTVRVFGQHAAGQPAPDGPRRRTCRLARLRSGVDVGRHRVLDRRPRGLPCVACHDRSARAVGVRQPEYLILNLALGGNYPRSVNKVERPYPGLPAGTVTRSSAATPDSSWTGSASFSPNSIRPPRTPLHALSRAASTALRSRGSLASWRTSGL